MLGDVCLWVQCQLVPAVVAMADGEGLLLAALAASLGEDISDHLPMTCVTCRERCADRAESWVHTHLTGHREFRPAAADAQDSLPCECRRCGFRAPDRAAARAHAQETGHQEFRVRGRHCSHCAGLSARCACTHGCPKPTTAECDARSSNHCDSFEYNESSESRFSATVWSKSRNQEFKTLKRCCL